MNFTLKQLREKAATMGDDIASMKRDITQIADERGWDDPQVVAMDEDITRWEQRYHHLLARIKRAGRAA